MKPWQAILPVVLASFCLFPLPSALADYAAAEKAFSEGQFEVAFTEYLADGSPSALNRLGLMHLQELCTACIPSEAPKYFKRAAEKGLADAQFNLGYLLEHSIGAARNVEGARKWYRLAAWQGHTDAIRHLEEISSRGEDITVRWYRHDAERGNANAQLNLGLAYHSGQGVEKDWYIALKWLLKAAGNGQVAAAPVLAEIYSSKEGGGYDSAAAVKWLEVAATAGDADAVFLLGQRYLRGDGVKSDYQRAIELLHSAAALGSDKARNTLLQLGLVAPNKTK